MLKFKKKYIFIITLAIILLIPFSYNVLAETEQDNSSNSTSKCVVETLVDQYKVSIDHVSGTGNQFRIYVNGSNVGDAEFRVTEVKVGTLLGNISDLGTIKKGQDLYLNIDYGKINSENAVQVEVALINSRDGCTGIDEIDNITEPGEYSTFYVTIDYTEMTGRTDSIYSGTNIISNPHIGTGQICTNFINGVYNTEQFNTNVVIKRETFDAYNYSVVTAEGKNFYQEMIPYCFNSTIQENSVYEDDKLVEIISDTMSIWKSYSTPVSSGTGSFLQEFNSIKNAAIAAGTYVGTTTSPAAKGTELSYTNKCEYTQTDYVTKNYYSAQIVDSQSVQYTYNYAPGAEKTETKTVCNRVCEESVKVEYGPPVASKAGLCFEYTVKVTSYVKCNADIIADSGPNIFDGNYCTPGGTCKSTSGYERKYTRAGPNEDFEDCVKSCDGGKYTQSCSVKCYKQVYGTSSNLKLNYENIVNASTSRIAYTYTEEQCLQENPDGCYIRKNGSIYWIESGEYNAYNADLLARYYTNSTVWQERKGLIGNGYKVDTNGFMRAVYSDGSECDDTCEWNYNDCSENSYLNPDSGTADNARNIEAYNSAVNACRASATCSQKTATYTIAVKYDTKDDSGNITVNKVYYPYTSSSQLKTNPSEGSNEYNLIDKDTFTNGVGYTSDSSSIIDYDGCYKTTDNKNWYLTEWGFPGTYINNKTGDISFAEPDDLSGWYQEKKKFCLPLNAETVNPTWWEWKVMGDDCVDTADIETELAGTAGTSNGYNIEAIANDFGYFGWDFEIDCFYATYKECVPADNACCAPPNGDPVCEDCAEAENYVLRTIDLSNLFPNSGYDVADENKRNIGFNWTSKATLLSLKVGNTNSVNPEELITQIQNKGESVYSEDPDYEFYLTPSDLSKLRNYNKNNSYTAWNGTSSTVTGINIYESNIFRGTGKLLSEESILNVSEDLGVFNE